MKTLHEELTELREENKKLRKSLIEQESDLKELEREYTYLLGVYEAARSLLRYGGVDADKAAESWVNLADAVEKMKLLLSGLLEEE